MGIAFGSKQNDGEKYKRYRLSLFLTNEEIGTLLDALEHADTSAYTRGDLSLSGKLRFLVLHIKHALERAKEGL